MPIAFYDPYVLVIVLELGTEIIVEKQAEFMSLSSSLDSFSIKSNSTNCQHFSWSEYIVLQLSDIRLSRQVISIQHIMISEIWCVCSVTWAIGVIPCQFGSLPCSKTFGCKEHLTGKINEPITIQPPPFLPRVIKRRTWEFKIQLRTYICSSCFHELYFLSETSEVFIQSMSFVFCYSE